MIDLTDIEGRQRKRYFIGVPFALLVVLLSPLLLLAPFAFIGCLIVRVDPIEAGRVLWGVLEALRGTHVEVTEGDHSVLVHIS
jgi:hypothetical protein